MDRTLGLALFFTAVIPATAFGSAEVCKTGGSGLNIRSSPSIHARRVGSLVEGASLDVGSLSRNGQWMRVVTSRGTGWVSRNYVCTSGDDDSLGSADGAGTGAGGSGGGASSGSGTPSSTGSPSSAGSGSAGSVVAGTCEGGSCPLSELIDDVNAATETGTCGVGATDEALAAKWNSGRSLTASEFVRFIAPMAQRSEAETGIPASVTIAQAALETAWGKTARRAANNLFGIKGSGNAGSVRLMTREYSRGRWIRVRARFAAYRSLEDSVIAHGRLISEKPLYARAMAVRNDPAAFARALQRAGYATDPGYANKLNSIIRSRNLGQYDGARRCEV